MSKILVAYTTNAGSTEDIARAVGEELARGGQTVDVARLESVAALDGYAAVVIGAPMILGWHRAAVSFVKKHRQALAQVPTAYFATALSLTQTDPGAVGTPVWLDPALPQPPKQAGRLSIKERYATLGNYLRPMLGAAPAVKPVSVAFLGGKLELFRLKWWQMLFVMVIIQAQPGDHRSLPAARAWAEQLRARLAIAAPA